VDDEIEPSTTKNVIDAIGGIVKAVPVYQDAIQPAAKELGKALGTATKSLNVLLAPIEVVIWGYERIKTKLIDELSQKVCHIPEEKRITPKPYIAVPAIEALRYLGHDDSLRRLYVNLLASAMNTETAHRAHPSFVEIIKQLTSDEAKILQVLSEEIAIPLISVHLYMRQKGIKRLTKLFSNDAYSYLIGIEGFSNIGELANCECSDLTQNYLNNLARLGLINVQEGVSFSIHEKYIDLENHAVILKFISENNLPDRRPGIVRYSAKLTHLGEQFIAACVTNIAS